MQEKNAGANEVLQSITIRLATREVCEVYLWANWKSWHYQAAGGSKNLSNINEKAVVQLYKLDKLIKTKLF